MSEENIATEETQEAPKKRTRATAKKVAGGSGAKNVAGESVTTKKTRARDTAHEDAAESVAESLAQLSEETVKRPRRTTRAKVPASIVFSANDEGSATLPEPVALAPMTSLLFQEPDVTRAIRKRRPAKAASENDDATSAPQDAAGSGKASDSGKSVETDKSADSSKKDTQAKRDSRKKQQAKPEEQSEIDDTKQNSDESKDESANDSEGIRKRRRGSRGGRRSADVENEANESADVDETEPEEESTVRRRRRRRTTEDVADEVTAPKGSTRLEAKRQRRKEGREAGRRRPSITESEYLARRESVNREMLIRERDGLNQIAVIEDGVLVEHYVARHTQTSMVGNVYLGRVQNVLPSMEAAFVDIGKGRNAVLYAGEVNWDATGVEPNKPRKIEDALKSGDAVLVQVTKDPIGHKGARLTGQITLAGRHLVLVPNGAMTGISRKLPDRERARLKKILKEVVPAEHGVIVRTAAEGATEEQIGRAHV